MTSDLFRRLKPFFILAIILGAMGCKIVAGRLEPFRKFGRIWTVIIAVGFAIITYKNIMYSCVLFEFFPLVTMGKEMLSLGFVYIGLFVGYYHRNAIIQFYEGAENYDNKVEMLGYKKKKNEFPLIRLVFAIQWGIAFFQYYYIVTTFGLSAVTPIKKLFPEYMMMYIVCNLCIQMYLVLVRFRHLNETVVPKLFATNDNNRPESFVLCQVKHLHSTLFNATRQFNRIYDGLLVMWLLHVIIETVLYFARFYNNNWRLPIVSFFQLIKILRVVFFLAVCERITKESKLTGYRAMEGRRIPTNSSDNEIWLESALYFHHHKAELTAWDTMLLRLSTFLLICNDIIVFCLIKISIDERSSNKRQNKS